MTNILTVLLKVVPKKYWVYLLVVLTTGLTINYIYKKGYDHGVGETKSIMADTSQRELKALVEATNLALADALDKQLKGLEAAKNASSEIDKLKNESSSLKQALDNAVNTQNSTCDTLSDEYYELYYKLYNTNPPV